MTKVLIIYATDYGSTEKMAQAVARGVESVPGASAVLKTAEAATVEDVLGADALILGTAVHMASMHWQMKKFIDTVTSGLWMEDKIAGKVGAVFASGSGYGNTGGGAELTMLSMLGDLAEMGLIIVPLPKNTPGYSVGGLHWGAYGRAHNEDLSSIKGGLPGERMEAAKHHGANVARVADAVKGRDLLNP